MIIGVDFDNTIVSYDEVFSRLALERSLVPPDTQRTKTAVRDSMRIAGKEELWTTLQGEVYGARMKEAHSFPGWLVFLEQALADKHRVVVISHKTQIPIAGPSYDLHASAREFLTFSGSLAPNYLSANDIFFEPTKEHKLQRIVSERCSVFIDDLPEILTDPRFPSDVQRILFAPSINSCIQLPSEIQHFTTWQHIATELLR